MHGTTLRIVLLVGVLCAALTLAVTAQEPAAGDSATSTDTSAKSAPADSSGGAPESFWDILRAGGLVGFFIILLSIGAVALVIEHVMTLRSPVLMPPDLAPQVRQMLAAGQVAQAGQRCQQDPCFLSYVLQAGIAEIDGGWPAVEKALEDTTAEQSARLFRKIEYLSVIGNIAPMLGLLGTVTGMIFAFREVADAQGPTKAADLAQGIYLALVTTVEGLIVAIPSLAAFAVFRNRVDQLVAEAAYAAQHVFAPLKRYRRRGQAPGQGKGQGSRPPQPPPVEGGG